MAKPLPRQLTVIRSTEVTPNMRRITIGGSELDGFPCNQESAYIKLLFPAGDEKLTMRTYTIRHHRADCNELDIDFMMHGVDGPASAWAAQASVGDRIGIAGPGGLKLLDFSADWFLLVGDMTSLPAMSVNIEKMPKHARGYAVIEVVDGADIQQLEKPDGLDIHWVVNPAPGSTTTLLLAAVTELPWLAGRPSIWAASEFETMRCLRRYFNEQRRVRKQDRYVSSYWKLGVAEDEHKVIKSRDAKAET